MVGNVIGQSRDSSNPVIVSFGAEGSGDGRPHGLLRAHNTLLNEGLRPALFVRITELQGPVANRYVNNLLIGLSSAEIGLANLTQGNFTAPAAVLRDADLGACALGSHSLLRGRGIAAGQVLGVPLQPAAEFTPPVGTRPLLPPAPPLRWSPVFYQ